MLSVPENWGFNGVKITVVWNVTLRGLVRKYTKALFYALVVFLKKVDVNQK
jgi:hypothetical protein